MRARTQRKWCGVLLWMIAGAMAAVLMVFFADPYRPGLIPGVSGPVELWAMSRKWQFQLLIGATGGASVASAVVWMIGRRGHRAMVAGLWVVFAMVLIVYHADRLRVMMEMMWRYR